MQRYARWLQHTLRSRGYTVELVRPVPWFSKLAIGPLRRAAVIKYLGYLDKFLIFPRQLRRTGRQFDLVHICDHSNSMYLGAFADTPAIITCHDLLAVRSALGEFSATRTGWTGRRLQAWILRGLQRAQNVICVSTKTAEDLTRLTGNASAQIAVILNPLNWNYKHQPHMLASLLARLGLAADKPYFLHVGGNQWYKNRPGVIRIFQELAAMAQFQTASLIMAGKPPSPELKRAIEQSGVSERVIIVEGAANEELEALYSNALALIFPSLEEGFGWPIAEAQACGCIVATTNRPPMTEVAGNAAIFFDPENPEQAARAIAEGIVHREQLLQAGLQNAARFNAGRVIEEYCAFYASVLHIDSARPASD